MNKFISICFAFVFFVEAFVPNMDMCEFKKLPNLFEHYQESRHDKNISLLDFLAYHYGNSQEDTSHHRDSHDENLPFQGQPCCHGLVFFPEQVSFSCQAPGFIIHERHSFYKPPVASEYFNAIFQPPQQV